MYYVGMYCCNNPLIPRIATPCTLLGSTRKVNHQNARSDTALSSHSRPPTIHQSPYIQDQMHAIQRHTNAIQYQDMTTEPPLQQQATLQLPALGSSPTFHPDCCLSLSTTIIATIADKLSGHGDLVLSVGSGSGLLETILTQHDSHLQIEGVEVSQNDQTVNTYLPEERIHVVNGTWAVSPLALLCSALLFVYPRDPSLLARYIQGAAASPNLEAVVWIGPKVDWDGKITVQNHVSQSLQVDVEYEPKLYYLPSHSLATIECDGCFMVHSFTTHGLQGCKIRLYSHTYMF
ncbi:hypothetical protein BT63DRAFT_429628 [Microthyrium microscopicum]|uniref:Uncharacterized protein n=1 Tax=Microthyrium microscopicum TaxID=703497 RepID=A0A6A6TYN1_9PEZI|nr:hypothetical protein BT63DRAFT_429628 [Microthyrium microscopicum]